MPMYRRVRSARGAVLIHVAVLLIVLTGISALAIDLGVSFVGRNQAQNAADAAALAAASSRSFANATETQAKTAAIDAAQANDVWGSDPSIGEDDISFPGCPTSAPGVPDTCVQANVFRTNYGGTSRSPLPTFFAGLFGVNDQGTRAMAMAQMQAGTGTADCVKPVAIPDRWVELRPNPATWTMTSSFLRYRETGPPSGRGIPLVPADRYDLATESSSGSGFTVEADTGLQLILKEGDGGRSIDPGWYYPVVIDPDCTSGAACYESAWAGCIDREIGPGTVLGGEPGNKVGPTEDGVEALVLADPGASWSTTDNRVVGGCMELGTCSRSPRIIAVPVFDVSEYQRLRAINDDLSGNGRNTTVTVVKVMGFFLEGMDGRDVMGRIMPYPTRSISTTGGPVPAGSSFARSVILVR